MEEKCSKQIKSETLRKDDFKMKKLMAICLSVLMVVAVCVTALAAPSGFVSSPSKNNVPEVLEFEASEDECTANLVIVPYAEKEELPDTLKTIFEKAYEEITTASDVANLNEDLSKLAAEKNIDGENLAVSDLFDIHVTGCDFHDGHYDFDVVLKAGTLEGFVGLLHMNKNEEWELVKDAKVTGNGEHLEFSVESFSPFAIVVENGSASAPTGVDMHVLVYVIAFVLAASVLAFIIIKSRKQKN